MHRRLTALAAGLVATLALAASPPQPPPEPPQPQMFDDESVMADCTQLAPRQTPSVSGVTDSGKRIDLDVRVLLDTSDTLAVAKQLRAAQTTAQKQAAQRAFADLVARYRPLLTPGDQSYRALDVRYDLSFGLLQPFNANGTPRDRSTDAARETRKVIELAKAQFGGARPAGTDLVYVLTDLDLYAEGIGDGVAGQADCIGGVEYPEHAFAVGEIFPAITFGPAAFYREGTAKIMAHELGHLMGAHHHYQSCGPHAVGETVAGGVGACSLMTNFVDFTTFEFSPLNSGIVRANAVDHADH